VGVGTGVGFSCLRRVVSAGARQLAYVIYLQESIACLAANCATLQRLLRGQITERVPQWSADTCPYWALRNARGCAELERKLKQRGAFTAINAVCMPPSQVGGRISQQPGAVVNRAAAAAVDEQNPDLARPLDEAGRRSATRRKCAASWRVGRSRMRR
jgi:hypothetical protein